MMKSHSVISIQSPQAKTKQKNALSKAAQQETSFMVT
jgi:hypothetical protein